MMPSNGLPKILYMADVPVEQSYAGATQLYRLLEFYPKDKLVIVQGMVVNNQKRLPGVSYQVWENTFFSKLYHSKFSKLVLPFYVVHFFFIRTRERKLIQSFQPDIILSVSFKLLWLKAFRLAKKYQLPFHIILHDEWLMTENYAYLNSFMKQQFTSMLQYAQGKFCISPNLRNYYQALVPSQYQVLYPIRGKNDTASVQQKKKFDEKQMLKYCYLGSLYTQDFPEMLNQIAQKIIQQGNELHIFSPNKKESLASFEWLQHSKVFFNDFIEQDELLRTMSTELDVAILLNSFKQEQAFQYNFSSKLVDYTAAGLPILFWGPVSAGAIQWAIMNKYSWVLTTRADAALAEKLNQAKEAIQRKELAAISMALGNEYFGYSRNHQLFINTIST